MQVIFGEFSKLKIYYGIDLIKKLYYLIIIQLNIYEA